MKKINHNKMTYLNRIIILLIIFSFSVILNAQTKKVATATAEIDKLYEKYKNTEIITLLTPFGNLDGNISIQFNDNQKPVSVTINGNSENKAAIADFISNTIKMKLKQGYKAVRTPNGWGFWSYRELVESGLGFGFGKEGSFQLLMRKGNMYFRVDAGWCGANPGYSCEGQIWEIETGDSKRQGGKKASNFEF